MLNIPSKNFDQQVINKPTLDNLDPTIDNLPVALTTPQSLNGKKKIQLNIPTGSATKTISHMNQMPYVNPGSPLFKPKSRQELPNSEIPIPKNIREKTEKIKSQV